MGHLAITLEREPDLRDPEGAVIWIRGVQSADGRGYGRARHAQEAAKLLQRELIRRGHITALLDATDGKKARLSSEIERRCFNDTVCAVAGDLSSQGQVIIVASTTPLAEIRQSAKLSASRLYEVCVEAGEEERLIRRLLRSL